MSKKFLWVLLCLISSCFAQDISEGLTQTIQYSQDEVNKIGYLEIAMDRPIDQSTFIQAKFAMEYFQKEGIIFLLVHLNTPGGEVFAAQKLARLLQQTFVQEQIPVVAFLDNWAVSAGAMLAYASRFIAITPSSIMGAAEPVIAKGGEMTSASEKVNSALRAEFMNLASVYNRNPYLAEAMVDKDVILVYRGGDIVKLQNEGQIRSSDQIITNKGKLLTLNSDALMRYGVADFLVPFQRVDPITDEEKKAGSWPASKSLLFQYPFFARIPNAEIITYRNWKVGTFSFLSHPVVASLLLMGMLIGFYLEINTPGFGVFGSVALGCLALILLNSFAVKAIHWLEVIILIAGLALIILEIFVIPGFGFIGILGIILTIIGLFTLMIPNIKDITFDPQNLSLAALSALNKFVWLFSSLIVAFILIFILGRYFFPRLKFFRHIVLKGEQEGYVSGLTKEMLPKVGEEGLAFTSLRPSGKIIIHEQFFDASSERQYIEKGEKIIVSNIRGNRIIVRKK